LSAFLIENNYQSDPSRIISTIVTGIGFLGGGVIIQHNDKILGVTTAAFIWVVSGIGILCGLGLLIMPIILTLGLLAVSMILGRIEMKIPREPKEE
jgi:putative Mg2+ transporter-C (MgtC) family protein